MRGKVPAVSARLDAAVKGEFEAAAAANDLTPSQVIRGLMRDYVTRYQHEEAHQRGCKRAGEGGTE